MKILLTLIVLFFSSSVVAQQKQLTTIEGFAFKDVINIDEDLSDVKFKNLKKIKKKDMKNLLIGSVILGYYENGNMFETIYFPYSLEDKEGIFEILSYVSETNLGYQFKGSYKITSKMCKLLDLNKDADFEQCYILYKSKSDEGIYYWAHKGKIYSKIVSIEKFIN